MNVFVLYNVFVCTFTAGPVVLFLTEPACDTFFCDLPPHQSLVLLLSSKGVTMGGGASTGSYTVEFASQVATTVCSNFLSSGKCGKDEAEVRNLHPGQCR